MTQGELIYHFLNHQVDDRFVGFQRNYFKSIYMTIKYNKRRKNVNTRKKNRLSIREKMKAWSWSFWLTENSQAHFCTLSKLTGNECGFGELSQPRYITIYYSSDSNLLLPISEFEKIEQKKKYSNEKQMKCAF